MVTARQSRRAKFLRWLSDGFRSKNSSCLQKRTGSAALSGGLGRRLFVEELEQRWLMATDTFATALSIGAVTPSPSTINASIAVDTEVDIVRFTVVSGQSVDFNINTPFNGPGGLGSYLRLFASSGQELASNNDGAAPGENVIGFDAYMRYTFPTSGTYYVGVSNYTNIQYNPITGNGDIAGGPYSTGAYTLIVNALPVDPDSTINTATQLGAISNSAKTVSAGITPDIDVDLYEFAVATGQVIDFNINTSTNGSGGLGSYLRLFDSTGQQLAFNDDAAAPGEPVVGFDAYLRYEFTTSGTYYIGVSNNTNVQYNVNTGSGLLAGGMYSIGPYSLIVSSSANNLDDPDDTLSEANSFGAISTTPVSITASIAPDIDVDMHRFSVIAGQVVDFNINSSANGLGGLGSYLRLFNSNGQQLAFNDDANAPGENVVGFDAYLRYTFASSGTYYISVSNNNNTQYDPITGNGDIAGGANAIGTYKLIVNGLPFDPDQTISTATNLGSITSAVTTVSAIISPDIDVDMYAVDVTAGQIVDFNINTPINGPGGLGSYLRLFNSSGQQLAFNDDAAAPGETVVGFDAYLRYTFPTAGTFYIGVSNYNNIQYDPLTGSDDTAGGFYSIGDYTLMVDTPVSAPNDPDDTLQEATSLGTISTTSTSVSASIAPDIDVDLYSFRVLAGQVVDFNIDTTLNGPGGLGSYLRLFDSAGVQLAFNDDANAPGENVVGFDAYLRYTFALSGTYYIGVSNNTNTQYDPITGNGDTAGGANAIGTYKLIVSGLPIDPDSTFANATILEAVTTTPSSVSASISTDIDVDMYQITVGAGQTVQINIDTLSNGPGGLDSYVKLFNSSGQLLASNDNAAAPGESSAGFDAYLQNIFAAGGIYYIGVANSTNTQYDPINGGGYVAGGFNTIGAYTLTVKVPEQNVPTTTLSLSLNVTSIPEANGAAVGTVTRSSQDISQTLTVSLNSSNTGAASVPSNVVIPANQTSATFAIQAVDDHIVDGTRLSSISVTAANSTSASIEIQVTDSDSYWTNVAQPLDVNDDGFISPIDVLLVINYINQGLSAVTNVPPPPYLDVNSNNFVDPLDALLIINYINSHTGVGGEGESSQMAPQYASNANAMAFELEPFHAPTNEIDHYFGSY